MQGFNQTACIVLFGASLTGSDSPHIRHAESETSLPANVHTVHDAGLESTERTAKIEAEKNKHSLKNKLDWRVIYANNISISSFIRVMQQLDSNINTTQSVVHAYTRRRGFHAGPQVSTYLRCVPQKQRLNEIHRATHSCVRRDLLPIETEPRATASKL